VKTPSRTFSSAVSVECPFLYADWNWLKLGELSRWGRRRANTRMRRRLSVKRLAKRIGKLIPETGCFIPKRAIVDEQG